MIKVSKNIFLNSPENGWGKWHKHSWACYCQLNCPWHAAKRVHAKETISLYLVVMTIVINAIEYTNTKVFSFNKIVFRINHFISLNLQCKPINRFNELTSISSYNIGLPRQPSASALRLTKMLQNAQKHGHQNHSILKAGNVESSYLICDLSS